MGGANPCGTFKLLTDARASQRLHRKGPYQFPAVSNSNNNFVHSILAICSVAIAAITNNQSMRPFLEAIINGSKAKFLYDTGSDITVISLKQFRCISVDKRPVKLNIFKQFKSATSTQLNMYGAYLLDITIFGKTIKQIVYVCENLNQNAILGMDAIDKLNLNYSTKNKRFFFEDSFNLFTTSKVVNAKKVFLPPLSATAVKVCALNPSSLPPVPNKRSIVTVHSEKFPMLKGGPGIVTTNSSNEMMILVHNCSPTQQEIPRGETLGQIENIHEMHIEQIHESDIAQTISAIQLKDENNLPSKARQQQILKELNLKVPATEKQKYEKLILENHDVFSTSQFDIGKANNFQHSIHLKNNDPVYIKQFRIPDVHREIIEGQVKEWLKVGVIQKSNSKYNCPIFLVPKKDSGAFRIVQDFRKLNANSLVDKYSMRDVTECIAEIGKAESSIFSTLDLTSGFWQLPLDEKSRQYTAFNLYGFGQFEWLVASMGLSSSPSAFQRLMELTLEGIKSAIVYIDDVLVHTKTHDEHRKELQIVFARLRKANLKLNLKKCEFGSSTVTYLGFRLTPQGILPGKDKLAAVQKASPPSEVKQIKQFLGLCNFFRSHIRNFASISNPLNKLTRKDSSWKGGPLPKLALQSFNELKTALCSEPVVHFPRRDLPYALIVDASTGNAERDGGFAAILCQVTKQKEFNVIAYASRGMAKHERNYSPFLAEMMSAVWAMNHFDNYLKGRHFTLFTDHKPLESLGKVHTKTLNRLQEAMNEFSFTIEYMKGADMPADFLSRNVLSEIDVFTPDLPKLQMEDEFVGSLRNYIKLGRLPSNQIQSYLVKKIAKECFFENDILWRRLERFQAAPRTVLLVPRSLTGALVQEAHGQLLTGHNGIAKTKERLLTSYYWPNMDATIADHVNSCQTCQSRRRDGRTQPHILSPLPQCSAPNQRCHLDLFGSLKTSGSGQQFVLCMTDAFTKYVELVAIPNKEAETVGLQFFNRWICRYGVPLEITTDQGREFVNKLNKELCSLLQIKRVGISI